MFTFTVEIRTEIEEKSGPKISALSFTEHSFLKTATNWVFPGDSLNFVDTCALRCTDKNLLTGLSIEFYKTKQQLTAEETSPVNCTFEEFELFSQIFSVSKYIEDRNLIIIQWLVDTIEPLLSFRQTAIFSR